MKLISKEEISNFNLRDLIDYQMVMYGLKPKMENDNAIPNYLGSNKLFIQEELLDEIIEIKRIKVKNALLKKIRRIGNGSKAFKRWGD